MKIQFILYCVLMLIFFSNCQNEPLVLVENPLEGVKIKRSYQLKKEIEKVLLKEEFYDTFGNIVKEINYKKDYFDDNKSPTVSEYLYDEKGENLIEKKYGFLDKTPSSYVIYEYKYNKKRQLIEEAEQDILDTEQDIQYEYYTYNDLGFIDTARSARFLKGQLFTHSSFKTFKYDKNGHLKKKIYFMDDDVFEWYYSHDKNGNLLEYNKKGFFRCGEDIAKRVLKYNNHNQIILEEVWNAMGQNWAFDYVYKNGLLFSKTYKTRFPIEDERYIGEVPPPPHYSQNDLEKNYTKTDITYYYYNDKQQLIKSVEKVLDEKGIPNKVYLFEYE